jgi:hypothetical protein
MELFKLFESISCKIDTFDLFNLSKVKHYLLVQESANFLDNSYLVYNPNNVSFKHIVGDIVELQINKNNNEAIFQVASQLNCLEMLNPDVSPLDGITNYYQDNTQGPKAVLCTPYALAWRNYLYKDYLLESQIDLSSNLLSYFKSLNININWRVKNGYLFIDKSNLLLINEILSVPLHYNNAKEFITVGFHSSIPVVIDRVEYNYVNHIFCSGIPLSYYPNTGINSDLWDLLSLLLLEIQYELTMMLAIYKNLKNNTNKPLYLTKIGVGAFGMKQSILIQAIKNAYKNIKSLKYKLDIRLVHYNRIDKDYYDIN